MRPPLLVLGCLGALVRPSADEPVDVGVLVPLGVLSKANGSLFAELAVNELTKGLDFDRLKSVKRFGDGHQAIAGMLRGNKQRIMSSPLPSWADVPTQLRFEWPCCDPFIGAPQALDRQRSSYASDCASWTTCGPARDLRGQCFQPPCFLRAGSCCPSTTRMRWMWSSCQGWRHKASRATCRLSCSSGARV